MCGAVVEEVVCEREVVGLNHTGHIVRGQVDKYLDLIYCDE